ncbi:MAG: hypothetical protein ACKOH8_06575, partial [Gemmatimonadota bacterium]
LAPALAAQDADRSVKDGGIKVAGWKGRVDRRPLQQGKTINDSRFVAADKLSATDGIWGIRASHNVELSVTGLMKH